MKTKQDIKTLYHWSHNRGSTQYILNLLSTLDVLLHNSPSTFASPLLLNKLPPPPPTASERPSILSTSSSTTTLQPPPSLLLLGKLPTLDLPRHPTTSMAGGDRSPNNHHPLLHRLCHCCHPPDKWKSEEEGATQKSSDLRNYYLKILIVDIIDFFCNV
jgi:hypothetical protein